MRLMELAAKHNLSIAGVVHVGAHHGQEWGLVTRRTVLIEPCARAFARLVEEFHANPFVTLVHAAMGELDGEVKMFVETANEGMSNSVLSPKEHLDQYPDIRFVATERVALRRLDSLDLLGCNTLVMDTQGYELHVLRGAAGVLRRFDYVYTEIMRAELYEGCARVEQLDEALKDFKRVETLWETPTWGNALYVRND